MYINEEAIRRLMAQMVAMREADRRRGVMVQPAAAVPRADPQSTGEMLGAAVATAMDVEMDRMIPDEELVQQLLAQG